MIKCILWDIDRTLLDFDACQSNSLKKQFKKHNLCECTDDMVNLYSEINIRHWQMLERGEVDKERLKELRFVDFFKALNITDVNISAFNDDYENGIGDTTAFIENSPEIISSLKGRVKQYAVTNGARDVQRKRLANAGFYEIFDGVFISDDVGYEKPSKEYFDFVLNHIEPFEKDEIIIVGDSLTSDMIGGVNAGIKTCRYNPDGAPNTLGINIDYEIKSLGEIFDII